MSIFLYKFLFFAKKIFWTAAWSALGHYLSRRPQGYKKIKNIKNEKSIFIFSKIKTMQLQEHIMVHGIGPNLVSNWKQNMIYSKSWYILCRKRIYMLIGLKVPSLAVKCVFYRPEHSENREHLKLNLKVVRNAKLK